MTGVSRCLLKPTVINQKIDFISVQTEEIGVMILLQLSLRDIASCKLVCKKWKRLSEDAYIQIKCESEYRLIRQTYESTYGLNVIEKFGGWDAFSKMPRLPLRVSSLESLNSKGILDVDQVFAKVMKGALNNVPVITLKYQYKREAETVKNVIRLSLSSVSGVESRITPWQISKTIAFKKCPIGPTAIMTTAHWKDVETLVKTGELKKEKILFQLIN